MRIYKKELLNLKILTKKEEIVKKKLVDKSWIIKITLLAFLVSFCFSAISESLLPNVPLIIEIVLVLLFIVIGVIFDMIGVAVTSVEINPFNSMASRKVKGAKTAVRLIQKKDKVSSFCNDVIGDICGIISGSAGALIAVSISVNLNINPFITSLFTTATVAALTIGGKALGKSYAVNKGNIIIFRFAHILSHFTKE